MTTNLDQLVLSLLEARRGDWQAVADASGVSYSWLSKFANGHIPNPGFATLTKLHENLTKPAVIAVAAPPAANDAHPTATASVKLLSPQHATSNENRGRTPRERRQGPVERRVSERSVAQRAARESKPAQE